MPPEPYRPQLPPPPARPFVSATRWARAAVALLAATIAVDVAALLFDLTGVRPPRSIGDWRNRLFVATGVVFLVWLHHAYRNLPALGARRVRFSPGWAVAWFFVPIANFVFPCLVVADVWIGSDSGDPRGTAADAAPRQRARAALLPACWWAAWLLSVLAGSSASMGWRINAAGQRLAWDFAGVPLVEEVLRIAAAALAVALVRGIDERQRRRAGHPGGEAVPGDTASPPGPVARQA